MSNFYKHQTLPERYYLDILKKHFPDMLIDHVEKKNGYDSVVLIINKQRLFKFPQREEVCDQYLLELNIFSLLSEACNFDIPKIVTIKGNPADYTDYVMEYEIMKGDHLTLEFKKNNFNHKQLEYIGNQIGAKISELHAVNTEIMISMGIEDFDSTKWSKEYKYVKENCFHLFNTEQIDWINDLYTEFLNIYMKQTFTPVFLHGDFGNWHIFSEKEDITGFIDFGGMHIGDPAFDMKCCIQKNQTEAIIAEALLKEYKKNNVIDEYFFDRIEFYHKRMALSKFIKGIKFDDAQRIKDGYILLEKFMKI